MTCGRGRRTLGLGFYAQRERLFLMVSITLSEGALSTLLRPARGQGGYQAFQEKLQQQADRRTRQLFLTADDQERLQRYTLRYGGGGWQSRLRRIFGSFWNILKGGF